MSTLYSSFLLRCWTSDGGLRIQAEHVQTGRQTLQSTFLAVLNWIEDVAATPQDETTDVPRRRTETGGHDGLVDPQDSVFELRMPPPDRVDG
jgi:hypothetical protein